MSNATRRRAQRRRHHAQQSHGRPDISKAATGSPATKTPAAAGDAGHRSIRSVLSMDKVQRWWWPVGLIVGPIVGAIGAPIISPHPQVGWTRIAGAGIAAVTFGVLVAVVRLTPVLGRLTTVALLGLVLGAVLSLSAWSLATCPGYPSGVRCEAADVVTYGMIGMFTPVVVALVAAGPLLVVGVGKRLWGLRYRLTGYKVRN